MKFKLSKGALFGYLLIFGVSGLVGLLRHLGLGEVADLLQQLDIVGKLNSEQVIALVMALIGLNQARPLVTK